MTDLLMTIDRNCLDAILCDFDGVLTDNHVYIGPTGFESVRCSRSDGLACDVLRALEIPFLIFSSEANPIVAARAAKLRVPAIQSITNKRDDLLRLSTEKSWPLERIAYIGNDLNDLPALEICGFRVCPADAHPAVTAACNVRLSSKGGEGVVREFVEKTLAIDFVSTLYS